MFFLFIKEPHSIEFLLHSYFQFPHSIWEAEGRGCKTKMKILQISSFLLEDTKKRLLLFRFLKETTSFYLYLRLRQVCNMFHVL